MSEFDEHGQEWERMPDLWFQCQLTWKQRLKLIFVALHPARECRLTFKNAKVRWDKEP